MDLRYFEDLMTLVECRSFAHTAKLRGISASSLSRRIQNIERSFQIQLIDRTAYPTKLTPDGHVFYEKALDIWRRMQELQQASGHSLNAIRCTMPPSLAQHFFAHWLHGMQMVLGVLPVSVQTSSMHDAAMHLLHDNTDFWITYYHPMFALNIPQEYEYMVIGRETFAPYSLVDWHQGAMHPVINPQGEATPFLRYNVHSYFHRISNHLLEKHTAPLQTVHEATHAHILRSMLKEGMGMAFLPSFLVKHDETKIVRADTPDHTLSLDLEIRLYRSHQHSPYIAENITRIWCELAQKTTN